MGERRLLGADLLKHTGQRRLAVVQAVLQIGELDFQPLRFGLAGAGAGGALVQLAAQLVELLRLAGQRLAQAVVIVQPERDAQLLQPGRCIPGSAAPWTPVA